MMLPKHSLCFHIFFFLPFVLRYRPTSVLDLDIRIFIFTSSAGPPPRNNINRVNPCYALSQSRLSTLRIFGLLVER